MVQNPYVINNIHRHDIGRCIVGTAPCGLEFTARVSFEGFDARPCPECFPPANQQSAD